ncbi:exported protein of unknown function [Candidatus Saccharimonas aalborgensis]|uniref:DUF4352 domain-containing protein n=1 Tax=Candidatus Saccharimonas aalborgensis TaxID=1332188 RepID=R4PWA7_9BACT|nr:DUF4352 domain-containing protein [Candidatus Saccharimonas aalborgensis]AGL62550.1 exported protein of unknown function [Candidatus Saccharimonas aalborgensis]MBP7775187.1 DUF4352 domain-containing protein [Candidatus Saccharimonas sp.]
MQKNHNHSRRHTTGLSRFSQVFFVISLLLCITSFTVLSVSYRITHPTIAGPSFHGLTLGSPVRSGVVEITVTKVTQTQGKAPYAAPTGKHFEVIDLLILNTGATPITITPTNDTYLKSADGTVAFVTPSVLDTPLRAGTLLPGERINGQLSYLVSDTIPFWLYIESDWSGGAMKFLLH